VPRETAWVSLLQQQLQHSHPQYKVINASISGETTGGGAERMPDALRRHKPAIVIIELGANDGLRGTPLKVTEKNLDAMIRKALAAKSKVLLLGMQLPPNYGASYVRQFAALFSDVAKARNAGYVPFILQGFGDRPELFQADRIHPTVQAQPLMVENVWPELSRFLTRVPTLGPTQGQSQSVRRP
jgi:acyl-CoA thioesterase-1